MMPKVSVVIPTKNGEKTIAECLDTIMWQSVADQLEIIVIDSGSTDKTLDIVRQYPVRLFTIEPQDFNHGLTRNLGVHISEGEYILFTVQDARLATLTFIEEAIKHFSDDKVMAVVGKQVVPHETDKNPLQWYRPHNPAQVIPLQLSIGEFERIPPAEKIQLARVDNVCTIYRREALQLLPFPKTDFGEDMLWAAKALNLGWKIVFNQNLLVYHYHHYDDIVKLKQRRKAEKNLYLKFGIEAKINNRKFELMKFFKIFYLVFLKKKIVPQRKIYWMRYNLKLLFG